MKVKKIWGICPSSTVPSASFLSMCGDLKFNVHFSFNPKKPSWFLHYFYRINQGWCFLHFWNVERCSWVSVAHLKKKKVQYQQVSPKHCYFSSSFSPRIFPRPHQSNVVQPYGVRKLASISFSFIELLLHLACKSKPGIGEYNSVRGGWEWEDRRK